MTPGPKTPGSELVEQIHGEDLRWMQSGALYFAEQDLLLTIIGEVTEKVKISLGIAYWH